MSRFVVCVNLNLRSSGAILVGERSKPLCAFNSGELGAFLTFSLVDAYIKTLSELEENAFQRAIVQRLLVALINFQSVPSYPQGDGGLDGHSHNGSRAYCCYGLKYDAAKTPYQRTKQLVKKFSSDLRRLYELETKGKSAFIHKNNDALLQIFGSLPHAKNRICHVSLIANWFESNQALGAIKQNASKYAGASKCQWIKPDADVVLRGPKEFADQYGVDESTMMWLKHRELLIKLDEQSPLVDVPQGRTFDTKMVAAESLLPGHEGDVKQLAEILRSDWQRAIVFESHLHDRLPQLRAALERGRRRLLTKVLTHKTNIPWEAISRAQEFGEEIFSDDFMVSFGMAIVRDLASGEVARLVGACHINWKGSNDN
jgi:hypothetical protein